MWVEKLDNGNFKFRETCIDPYTEKVKKVSVTMDRDTPQVRKQAFQILQDKIKYNLSEPALKQNVTFYKIMDEWFDHYKQEVRHSSYVRQIYINKVVKQHIGKDTIIRKVDKKLLLSIIDSLYTFGNTSLDYTRRVINTIKRILDYALEREYLSENIAEKVKIQIKTDDKGRRRNEYNPDKYLEKSEVDQIIDFFRDNPKEYWLHERACEILYLTGLRYGELMALQWRDFDGEDFIIRSTYSYHGYKKNEAHRADAAKTASSTNRVVSLPQKALDILAELKEMQTAFFDTVTGDSFIFSTKDGYPLQYYTFNKSLKKAEEVLKVNKHLTTHIFRHSHISYLAENNVPIRVIMDRVGHSDPAITLSIYNHVTEKSRQNLIDILNKA